MIKNSSIRTDCYQNYQNSTTGIAITGKFGWVWVGVIVKANEEVFRYASSGVPVSDDMRPEKPTWADVPQNCVRVYTGTTKFFKKWDTYECDYFNLMSVCEPTGSE